MNKLINKDVKNVLTLDSREVADMVEKDHRNLLRDIRGYMEELGELKIEQSDFFIPSTFTNVQNKELPKYLVTKKGCEFISHKLTGIKGTAFTATYINRFHELDEKNDKPKQIDSHFLFLIAQQMEQQEKQITEMKPKALFADAVSTSHTSILVGELAKLINQNGVDIGQNRLFGWLRERGFLIRRKGTDYNMPTQYSMDLELFEIKERSITNPDGSVRITKTPKVTGKGQQYFINKFLNKEEVNNG